MTTNIRFDWEKDNFLSKMRDMKWIIMQVLLKDMISVTHGDHHRLGQCYLRSGQLWDTLTNETFRVPAAVDGACGLSIDCWKVWFKMWILGLSSARVWNSARTKIFWLLGRTSCLHGASLHPKSCLRYFIPHLLSSYLKYNTASRSFASDTSISTFPSGHKELCAVITFFSSFLQKAPSQVPHEESYRSGAVTKDPPMRIMTNLKWLKDVKQKVKKMR